MTHGLICDTSVKYLHILQHDQFTSANVYNMNMPQRLMHFSASFFCVIFA